MNDGEKKDEITYVIEKSERKKEKLLYTSIILITVIFLASAYLLVPDVLGYRKTTSSQIRQMTKLTSKIGKLETEAWEKWEYMLNLIDEYSQKTGDTLPALDGLGLSDDEKKILVEKINNSKDVTFQSLLRDILSRDKEISGIKKEINAYEALLPTPHIVEEGEYHYQIAMNFLLHDKGIAKEKAIRLVGRSALFDPLRKGFKVWNFYSGEEYGTFVTQGYALISPNIVSKEVKKKLIDERDKAVSEKEKLTADIKNSEERMTQASSEAEKLRKENEQLKLEKNELSKTNSKMEGDIKKMEKSLNSLSYIVDTEKNLIISGILKKIWLRSPYLEKMPSEDNFKPIDLRNNTTIEFYAEQFKQLSKLKGITLYPKFYERDKDYKVKIEEDKKKAVLTILDIKKFETNRVVISVE